MQPKLENQNNKGIHFAILKLDIKYIVLVTIFFFFSGINTVGIKTPKVEDK